MMHVRRFVVAVGLFVSLAAVAAASPAASRSPRVDSIILSGTVVTPDRVIADGRVLITGNTIEAVGDATLSAAGVRVVAVDGIIFPGLIDLHNHITWNAFPRWKPPQLVTARYDWLAMPEYQAALNGPHAAVQAKFPCDLERYGEVKAIIGGATSITGSLGPLPGQPLSNQCVEGLARNLDVASDLNGDAVNQEALQYKIFPLEMSAAEMDSVRRTLSAANPVIVHLSEGTVASAARELTMVSRQGLLQRGLTIIHGVALSADDFATVAKAGVGMVWSPRSNIELYGRTANVGAAKAAGVTMAISPDWSPSGSNGMLDELRYAAAWNARQTPPIFTSEDLFRMATINAATLGGLAAEIGGLEPGKRADILVVQRNNGSVYDALVDTPPQDVMLVMIDGHPIYGDAALLGRIAPATQTEQRDVCGAMKAIDMSSSDGGRGISLRTTLDRLDRAFQGLKPVLAVAPLFDCP